jgi:hypothetical protein
VTVPPAVVKCWNHFWRTVDRCLSNAAVILILGAFITGLLVPHITMTWQNGQKALDLKTTLVTQLSDSATKIIVTTQLAELGTTTSSTQSDLTAAYKDWAIESAALGSELRAYYPNTSIGDDWGAYANVVTNFYALTGVQNPHSRKRFLQTIRTGLLPFKVTNVDWELLSRWDHLPLRTPKVQATWYQLRIDVLNRKNTIIQEVLDHNIASY